MKGDGAGYIILACLLYLFFSPFAWAADDLEVENDQPYSESEALNLDPAPSISEVERAIEELYSSAPNLVEKIAWIRMSLSRLEGGERDRLAQSFDARMKDVIKFEPNTPSPAIDNKTDIAPFVEPVIKATNDPVSQESLPKDMKDKIDSLNLGANSTVDDLRKRDELVGSIAGIQDPSVRYELLQYLEKKETESQPR